MEEAKALFFFFFFFIVAASSLPANFAGNGSDASDALAKDADFIDELPNQPESIDFRQYSGYLLAEPVSNRRFFYYFVEAEDIRPLSKPLIIYIGAPSVNDLASALLSCFQQVGPYTVGDDGQTLIPNPFSWNKFANILFIEGPVGVGFSLSDNDQDIYETQEFWIIADMYHFIVRWMKRFPEHKNNDVYIAGQSYIGALGPGLATYILYMNTRPDSTPISIRGILMGNPKMDSDLEFITRFEAKFRMNIISEEILRDHRKLCHVKNTEDVLICWKPIGEYQRLALALDGYNVYSKFCPNIDIKSVGLDNFKEKVYDCNEQCVAGYLNIPFVQLMMHVQSTPWGPPMWQPYDSNTRVLTNISSSTPYIKAAMAKGVRVLIYSGVQDDENVIPNMIAIKSMNLTISSEWRPWFDNKVEVAGFVESYVGGLTYATVRAAGMKVMIDQPERGFILAKSFITNSSLPFTKFV
ncbi:Serine carboxypeptidase-like 36 [Dendrobium catenatum]|uniref:Serine carboxypeptidase-like 36 n=1 Tax=Dendrobium catenatum TaxID=906689 RepID=A0A2I0XCN8_9ASPA|nr:Serine carboxypeptidase-like 36 [Dendrobium catenatum]